MTKAEGAPDLFQLIAALALAAFGAYWFWTAWTMFPPPRESLTMLQVYPRDFGVENVSMGVGSRQGNMRRDQLTVSTPAGSERLSPPRGTAIARFATDASVSLLTVHANLSSGTIMEVSGHGKTYLAYEEAASSARSNAWTAMLIGLICLCCAGYIVWRRQ